METIVKFEIGKTYSKCYICVNRSDKFFEFQVGEGGIVV